METVAGLRVDTVTTSTNGPSTCWKVVTVDGVNLNPRQRPWWRLQLWVSPTPAIRDAVLDSFAFDPKALQNIASPETLDRIAANALGLRLDDQALAADIYVDIRNQVIRAPKRWHDVSIAIELTPWTAGPATGRGSMFVATLRWEHRVTPASLTMRFACISDPREYRDLLRDQVTTSAWYFDQSAPIDAAARDAFELVQLSVNGKVRTIRRTECKGAQLYTASLGPPP